jgi:hypothetical protein
MRKGLILSTVLGAGLISMLHGTMVQAQNYRSYVATYGSGSACTRTAPCLSFQGAHNVTNDSGEISCLDSGDFGGGTFSKSITVDCSNNIASVYYAIDINAPGGFVILRGITVLGNGVEPIGIDIRDGSVLIENSKINAYRASSAIGIRFAPSSAGAKLLVNDSVITYNAGSGIEVRPGNGVSGKVTLSNVRLVNNRIGFSVFNRSHVTVRNSTVSNSTAVGVRADGSTAVVRMPDSTVSGNKIGLNALNGGQIISHRGNVVADNQTNGAFTSAVSQQ